MSSADRPNIPRGFMTGCIPLIGGFSTFDHKIWLMVMHNCLVDTTISKFPVCTIGLLA